EQYIESFKSGWKLAGKLKSKCKGKLTIEVASAGLCLSLAAALTGDDVEKARDAVKNLLLIYWRHNFNQNANDDATTIWLFREALAQAGLIDKLSERFGQHLETEGYIARGGQIIDATIVSVPKQRNTKEENEAIKAGKTPEGWEQQPAKNAQKDKDARWTKKN